MSVMYGHTAKIPTGTLAILHNSVQYVMPEIFILSKAQELLPEFVEEKYFTLGSPTQDNAVDVFD